MPDPLQLGAHQGQRRAQLVGGVGEELPLAGGAGLDAGEQVVEGVAQAGQLVVAVLGDRQPAELLVAGAGRGPAVPLHRPQGGPGRAVAHEGGAQQGDQPGEEQLQQELAQGLVVLAAADRGRHHPLAERRLHQVGADAVAPRRGGREHPAGVEVQVGAGGDLGDLRGRQQRGDRGVPAEHRRRAAGRGRGVQLVGQPGGVGRRRTTLAGGRQHHAAPGGEVLVELAVQGVLHPPEHEPRREQQDRRHRDGDGEHQPRDDRSPTHEPTPEPTHEPGQAAHPHGPDPAGGASGVRVSMR